MAKSNMKWSYIAGILSVEHIESKATQDFGLTDLYESFADLEEVVQSAIINGVKQKLADKCAAPKELAFTDSDRKAAMQETWDRITIERKWNSGTSTRETPQKKAQAAYDAGELTDAEVAIMAKIGIKIVAKEVPETETE